MPQDKILPDLSDIKTATKITPLMEQYNFFKSQHPDKVVLFRLGDFFEIFGEDAITSSKILQIQLTARNKSKGNNIPMCGIPAQSLNNYLYKLIQAGKRVVICDQIGDPVDKGIMQRKITQIITPGTFFDENILKTDNTNYLCIINIDTTAKSLGMVFCDLSTGKIFFEDVLENSIEQRYNEIYALYEPSEILLPESLKNISSAFGKLFYKILTNSLGSRKDQIQWLKNKFFDASLSWQKLSRKYKVSSPKSLGLEENSASLIALGALFQYLSDTEFTNLGNLEHLELPAPVNDNLRMRLSDSTIRSLELFQGQTSTIQPGLYSLLNQTKTPMGARGLIFLMQRPFNDHSIIKQRLIVIKELLTSDSLLTNMDGMLSEIGDLERFTSRLSLPGMSFIYLAKIKNSIQKLGKIKELLSKFRSPILLQIVKDFDDLVDISEDLNFFLESDLNSNNKNTYSIKAGVSQELDEARFLARDTKNYIVAMEKDERQKTGISSLKIGYNRIFGYYIEISRTNKLEIPDNYIRKQTLTSAERFTTPQMQELESKVLQAQLDVKTLEDQIFDKLYQKIKSKTSRLKKVSHLLGEIDVFWSLAKSAKLYNYVEPNILDMESSKMEVKHGNHPLLKVTLDNKFISNDIDLDSLHNQILIITGPNMGGKSTFMRQAVLTCYMAQIGSFVDAKECSLTVFDRIFTRIGASDNISKGQSTFMMEMSETAEILNQATNKSLIVLDELGRGTSTFDGVGIAWAVIEYLENLGAITLFATHYYELTKLRSYSHKIFNAHVSVSEDNSNLVFTHKILPGASEKSYGIQVARLAGVPTKVLAKAREVYNNFSQRSHSTMNELANEYIKQPTNDFDTLLPKPKYDQASASIAELVNRLLAKNLDNMTPKECYLLLCELQNEIKQLQGD